MHWTSRANLQWPIQPVRRPIMALLAFLVLFAALLALATAASATREVVPLRPAASQVVHTTSSAEQKA